MEMFAPRRLRPQAVSACQGRLILVASRKWEMGGGAVNPPLASMPWQQDPSAIRLATETVPPVLTLQRRPPEPQADI